jgi:outer membrane protein assembly factor BamB
MGSCRLSVVVASAALFLTVGAARAADWPHWRGPNYHGSSPETGLPVTWTLTENVAWQVAMPGASSATPAVSGDRIFVSSTAEGTEDLRLLCLSTADGRTLWSRTLSQGRSPRRNTMATPSPATDGDRVVVLFGNGTIAALGFGGEVLWKRDLAADYDSFGLGFGYSASPLLWNGRVYVGLMRRQSPLLIALDAATGETAWAQERPTEAQQESLESYSSPVPYEHDGTRGVVLAGADLVTCNDADTGEELWRCGYSPQPRPNWRLIPTPTVVNGMVWTCIPRGGAVFAVAPPASPDAQATVAVQLPGKGPDVASAAYYDGLLYVLDGERQTLRCVEPADGTEIWRENLGGTTFWASPTAADGRIYCIDVEGRVKVVRAGRGFELLGTADMAEPACHATIAAAGGSLYLRTPSRLYCIRERD